MSRALPRERKKRETNSEPRSDVTLRDSVFGEHVSNKYNGEVFGGAMNGCRNEDTLFGESVYDHKNGVAAGGHRKGFDEVHGYGVPRAFRDRELFEETVGFMSFRFSSHTGSA